MIAYFTGIRPGAEAGHYCYTSGYGPAKGTREVASPWADVFDAHYNPNPHPLGDGAVCDLVQHGRHGTRDQPEGEGSLYHKDGWTLLHLWDRSGADKRGGCHASFAFNVVADAAAVRALIDVHFPGMLGRIEAHLGRSITITVRP